MPSARPTASAAVRLSPVSMTSVDPLGPEVADGLAGRVLERVGDGEKGARPAVHGEEDDGPALRDAPPPPGAASAREIESRAPRRRPGCRGRPSAPRPCPRTPRPVEEEKPSTGASARPRSSAARTIAAASGCSLPRSRLAARRRASGSSPPSRPTTATEARPALGEGAGLVDDERVHAREGLEGLGVLHEDAGRRRRGPTPTMIDIGVARPRAQGQAMMRTDTAATRA